MLVNDHCVMALVDNTDDSLQKRRGTQLHVGVEVKQDSPAS